MNAFNWICAVSLYLARLIAREPKYSPRSWALIEASRELRRLYAERKV